MVMMMMMMMTTMIIMMINQTNLEADAERVGECQHDENPGEYGQHPSAEPKTG